MNAPTDESSKQPEQPDRDAVLEAVARICEESSGLGVQTCWVDVGKACNALLADRARRIRALKINAGGQDDGTGNHAEEKVATPAPPASDAAPQEPTQHTARPVSDSPIPAAAAPHADVFEELPETEPDA